MKIHPTLNWECLTPQEGHYAFGYYDRCPWDSTNTYHLAVNFPQQQHLPEPGEKATVGYIHRGTKEFIPAAETEAWCHQQGSMTLWLKHQPDSFVYNDFEQRDDEWIPLARIYDTAQKKVTGQYDIPVYVLSKDGKWGVSLNFSRIPRRGYSYARAPLPENYAAPNLDEDGLFLIDMESGKSNLIASYRQMMAIHPIPYDLEGCYLWLNHPSFNSDGSRVMVLFRHQRIDWEDHYTGRGAPWRTYIYTMNHDGSDLRCALPDMYWRNGGISHQLWGRTPREILVDANWCDRGHQYVVFDERSHPVQAVKISDGMGPAGHLIFSPDNQWLVADTYANKEHIQLLGLVNVATGELQELGRFNHPPENARDLRCDLHPRWSADGSLLTVDTIHDGDRKIYMLDMQQIYK